MRASLPAFTAWARTAFRFAFTPAQEVLCAVAFDRVDPSDLEGERADLARTIFGDLAGISPVAWSIVVILKGARIGGTLLSSLRLLHLALTVPLLSLAPGERAYGLIVGPDQRLARQGLRYALGHAQRHKGMAARIVEVTKDSFTIRRDDGQEVVIECLPATRGGSATRGRSLVGAVMTEAAFFRDSDSVVNDAEVYRSLAPRMLPGAQLIIESTPWAEAGLLFELFDANHGDPSTALAARCPTLLMRTDRQTAETVARERERDPDNAAREFDACFMSAGLGLFLDPQAIDACVDDNIILPGFLPQGARACAGADFGFVRDSSAIVVVAACEPVLVLAIDELRPARGAPLRPSAVASRFVEVARPFGCKTLCSDGHYRESIVEHLRAEKFGFESAPEGQQGKATSYLHLRQLINERRIRLPRHARLIAQLKALVSKPTPGAG